MTLRDLPAGGQGDPAGRCGNDSAPGPSSPGETQGGLQHPDLKAALQASQELVAGPE